MYLYSEFVLAHNKNARRVQLPNLECQIAINESSEISKSLRIYVQCGIGLHFPLPLSTHTGTWCTVHSSQGQGCQGCIYLYFSPIFTLFLKNHTNSAVSLTPLNQTPWCWRNRGVKKSNLRYEYLHETDSIPLFKNSSACL